MKYFQLQKFPNLSKILSNKKINNAFVQNLDKYKQNHEKNLADNFENWQTWLLLTNSSNNWRNSASASNESTFTNLFVNYLEFVEKDVKLSPTFSHLVDNKIISVYFFYYKN